MIYLIVGFILWALLGNVRNIWEEYFQYTHYKQFNTASYPSTFWEFYKKTPFKIKKFLVSSIFGPLMFFILL
jgi:hypothetical protein